LGITAHREALALSANQETSQVHDRSLDPHDYCDGCDRGTQTNLKKSEQSNSANPLKAIPTSLHYRT